MSSLNRAATEAMELARRTSDQNKRAALLDLALKCAEQVPVETESQCRLDDALQEFNSAVV